MEKRSWVSEGPTQLVRATSGGSTLGMEILIFIPSGGLKQLVNHYNSLFTHKMIDDLFMIYILLDFY